jgi:hypothetical protein
MGDPTSMKKTTVDAQALRISCFIAVVASGIFFTCSSSKGSESMVKYFELIEKFKVGEEFNGDCTPWLKDGKPVPDGVEALADALGSDSEFVQEQAAIALIDIGKNSDPLAAEGGDLLRDPSIIKALLKHGISRENPTRDRILDVCVNAVPADHLKPHAAVLVDNLIKSPDDGILLAIAKAKPGKAKDVLEKMLLSPNWANNESALVAAGALGDEKAERYLTDKFLKATEPDEKIHFAKLLGYMGTRNAGVVLASEMRTDMIKLMPRVYTRSVRLDIVNALHLMHPDKVILFENEVNDDAAYEKIENFCIEQYGVKWSKNRPPFHAMQGFPSNAGK